MCYVCERVCVFDCDGLATCNSAKLSPLAQCVLGQAPSPIWLQAVCKTYWFCIGIQLPTFKVPYVNKNSV